MPHNVHFVIDNNSFIQAAVPQYTGEVMKYKSIDHWNRFDDLHIRLIQDNICLDLKRDHAITSLKELYNVTQNVIYNKNTIPKYTVPGYVGKELNKIYATAPEINIEDKIIDICSVWSHCVPISTLIYSYCGYIYLEIAPIYPWVFSMMRTYEQHIYYPFENFLYTYKPYVITQISRKQCLSWQKKAYTVLHHIGGKDIDSMLYAHR